MNGGSYTFGQFTNIAMAGEVNNVTLNTNGVNLTTDTSVVMPGAATQIRVGSVAGGLEYLNGSLKELKYYPIRIPNTQLQLLTQ